MNTSAKGRRNENELRKVYEACGWTTEIPKLSKGPWDFQAQIDKRRWQDVHPVDELRFHIGLLYGERFPVMSGDERTHRVQVKSGSKHYIQSGHARWMRDLAKDATEPEKYVYILAERIDGGPGGRPKPTWRFWIVEGRQG